MVAFGLLERGMTRDQIEDGYKRSVTVNRHEEITNYEGRRDGKLIGQVLGYFSDPQDRTGKVFVFPHICAEITAEYLLERDSRREEDQRYDFANLAFTDLEQITFDGPEAFVKRAEHFTKNAEQRRRITRQMQQAVNELFTYDALAARLIRFIRRQLQAPSE